MNDNYKMSPLAQFLVRILRTGSYVAAVLLVFFGGILLWQRHLPDGSFNMSRQDWSFLGVLAVLALLAIYLVRAIGKELKNPGG
jgi:hypothetical protein